MTTISYKRRGGTLGQELTANFDLNSMPTHDSQRLHHLLNESHFFEIPVVDAVPSSPDEFEYIITVISENSIHTVSATDNLMPRNLRALIQDLTELAIPTHH
jgi:emfourin